MDTSAVAFSLTSVVLWSTLAFLGAWLQGVPPLLLVGSAFLIGALPALRRPRELFVSPGLLALGVAGLLGYHLLLFMAFRLAPPVEANLLNYTWPILVVVLSPLLLRGYRLRAHHVAGGLVAFAGAALIVTGGRLALRPEGGLGYLCALGAAATWSCYSLLTKRLPPFSTFAVGGFCLVSGLLALALHGVLEPRFVPDARQAAAILALGLGPMGIAFYSWDAALKRGDPRIIGSLSYLTPLLSTLNLALFGGKALTRSAAWAMALIVGGALLGALDLLIARDGAPVRES